MPLFKWDESSLGTVTNQHFWIYWAAIGPLTLTFIAPVITWTFWNNGQLQKAVKRARRGVGGKVAESDGDRTERAESFDEEDDEIAHHNVCAPIVFPIS